MFTYLLTLCIPSLISLMVSVDVKPHVYLLCSQLPSLIGLLASVDVKQQYSRSQLQSSGAVRKSRWPSWAPVPNKPTVSVDVKQRCNPPTAPSLVAFGSDECLTARVTTVAVVCEVRHPLYRPPPHPTPPVHLRLFSSAESSLLCSA